MTALRAEPPAAALRLRPAPTAMVWLGVDRAHAALAVPAVALGPGDALVEVELATICGSDVHTTTGRRSAPAPLVLGHEAVGRVVATGPGAVDVDERPLRHGDRVVWSIAAVCGACDRCTAGRSRKCRALRKYGHERVEHGWELSGGFATHVHVRAGTPIVPVDGRLDPALLAPVSCGTATAVAALDALGEIAALADEVVVVSGAGLIGLTAAALAADAGARVVVADPDDGRRALSRAFGAVATADPTAGDDEPTSLASALDAVGGDVRGVVEASGAGAAVESVLRVVGTGGVVALVGSVFPAPPVALDAESVVRRLVTLRGVHNYEPRHLVAAARFVERRARDLPFAALVGDAVPLAEIDRGLELAGRGTHVRVGVRPPTVAGGA